jgi:hypothetical protein
MMDMQRFYAAHMLKRDIMKKSRTPTVKLVKTHPA